MTEDFTSLTSLVELADDARSVPVSGEKRPTGPDPVLLAGQVATFKERVLASRQVIRLVAKARRRGIYAVRPWQWAVLSILFPLTIGAVVYAGWRASRDTRAFLAMNQAVLHAQQGEVRSAEDETRRAISFGKDPAEAFYTVGMAFARSRQTDPAVVFLDFARVASNYTAVDPQLEAARIVLELRHPDEALQRLQVAAEMAGKYPEFHLLRARADRDLGRFDEARSAALEALERDNNSLTARWILFEVARLRGDSLPMRENQSILLARTPRGDEPTEVQIGLARLYLTQDRRKSAREILNRVLSHATQEQLGEIYYTRGLLGITEKRYAEALADLDEAVRRAPRNPDYLTRRAEVRYLFGRTDEALDDLARAIGSDPLHARARYNLAWILWADIGDPRAAHPHFEAAQVHTQDFPHLSYALAATRYAAGDYEGARSAFAAIPEAAREVREAQFLRGILALRTGRIEEATEVFRGLVAGSKREPRILSNLGLALELSGDTISAGRLYWEAMAASPSPAEPDPIAERNLQNFLHGRLGAPLDDRIHEELEPRPASFLQ